MIADKKGGFTAETRRIKNRTRKWGDISIRGDCGVGTCLAQTLPLFRQVNVEIGFRPEDPAAKVTGRAAQQGKFALAVRLNAATAAEAVNIVGYEAGLRGAVRKEAEPVGISRNSHFPPPLLSRFQSWCSLSNSLFYTRAKAQISITLTRP